MRCRFGWECTIPLSQVMAEPHAHEVEANNVDLGAALREFCSNADAFLRRGAQDLQPDRLATLDVVRVAARKFHSADEEFQVLVARSAHLLADLFDKFGEDESAAQVLTCYVEAAGDGPAHRTPAVRAEERWLRWAESVNRHRREGAESAIAITSALLREIDGEDASHDFLARLHYAHGRHLQKAGRIPEAEDSFAIALEHAESLSKETARETGRPRLRYAHLLVSLNLVQFARISMERGDLRRAWRLLAVAGSLQAGIEDPINKAFVDLYKGSVLRQQHKLEEAIRLLEPTADSLKHIRHARYLMRCQYEVAKAYLNRAELPAANAEEDLQKARAWLEKLSRTRESQPDRYRGDERLRHRFEVKCNVLAARIDLKRGRLDLALTNVDKAFARLQHALAGSSRDLLVLATWVKGNILVEAGRPVDAIAVCLDWVHQRDPREPADKTDDSWVDLVLWKAHICNDDLSSAQSYRNSWQTVWGDIENVYVQQYARDVTKLHDERTGAGFFVDAIDRSGREDYWNWRQRQEQLQRFLLTRVVTNYPDEGPKGWATRLDLTPQQVGNLLRQKRIPEPPASPSAPAPRVGPTRRSRTKRGAAKRRM